MKNLIPHFISNKFRQDKHSGHFFGCSMFLDIYGFTDITEKMMLYGKEGAEILSSIINSTFKDAITQIYKRNGFISSFIGDAFIAIFNGSSQEKIITAALEIRNFFAKNKIQKTKFGDFELFIKIGLAYGKIEWNITGIESHCFYSFKGECIENSTKAQEQCFPMDIVLDKKITNFLSDKLITSIRSDGFYCLTGCQNLNIKTVKLKASKIPADILSNFIIRDILTFNEGEFRNIVSVYISFNQDKKSVKNEERLNSIINKVNDFGGYISLFDYNDKGLTLVVFFGVPKSYENNINRSLNFITDLRKDLPGQFRSGLAFGTVYAGIMGNQIRSFFTCLGNVVNLSCRLMEICKTNEILTDKIIADKAFSDFKINNQENRIFKGFSHSVETFKLEEKKKVSARLFQGKIFGREEEYNQIVSFLEPVDAHLFAGILFIQGFAGIGKSRLVNEVKKNCSEQKYRWLYLPCDEVLKKSFNPIIYFLNNFFNQKDSDSEELNKQLFESKFTKLVNRIRSLTLKKELFRTKSILGSLLNLHWEKSLYEGLDNKSRYDNTLKALKNLFMILSEDKPLIVELDDSHWIDKDSATFFSYLFENITNLPIAVISACRLNDDGSLYKVTGLAERYTQNIILNSLSPQTTNQLIKNKLNVKEIDCQTLAYIHNQSQGNPFMIEQIVLYLRDHNLFSKNYKIAADRIDIPTDINSIIIARIDRLSNELKEIIKTASVLGREFFVTILNEMLKTMFVQSKTPHLDLSVYLNKGENEQIWDNINEISYLFKHALIREAVYEMQLKNHLRYLHKLAGEAIESLYKKDLKDHLDDLVYHFEKAEIQDKTITYLKLLGNWAKEKYLNEKAVQVYNKIIDKTDNIQEKIDCYFNISEVYEVTASWNKAIEPIQSGISLADNNFDLFTKLKFLTKLGRIYERKGEFHKSIDILIIVKNQFEQNCAIIKTEEQVVYTDCLHNLAVVSHRMGEFDKSLIFEAQAIGIKRKIKDYKGLADCLNGIGIVAYVKGNYKKALIYYMKALKIRLKIHNRQGTGICLNNIGAVHYILNNYPEGLKYQYESLKIFEEIGAREHYGHNCSYLAYAEAKQQNFEAALNLSIIHFNLINEIHSDGEKGRTHLAVALCLSALNKNKTATIKKLLSEIRKITGLKTIPESFFEFSIKIAKKDNYLETLVPATYEYGKYLVQNGNKTSGLDKLSIAYQLAKENDMKGEVKTIKWLLSRTLQSGIQR